MQLNWIRPGDLNNAISKLQARAHDAFEYAKKRQSHNVIDPFQSLMMASTLQISDAEDLKSRQSMVSASQGMFNAIGAFHQDILSSVSGWINHDAGYDLECKNRKILAEIKNKHNTMNSTNRRGVINELETAVRQKSENWSAYLVIIVPKKPGKYEKKISPSTNVFEIDGASFYDLVAQQENAMSPIIPSSLSTIKTRAIT